MLAAGRPEESAVSQPVRRAARRGAVIVLLATSLAISVAVGARAATGPYVALGDSYTSAPLVPDPTGNPILCGRSTNNYPQDVKRAISPASFTDASCSSATTTDMTQSQSLEGGLQTALPQFNALGTQDALVTVGIGGNDAGLISVAEECAELDAAWPFGSRCKSHYQSGGSDTEVAKINAAGPKVASTIQGIHARAPKARVLVVGYPDGLPQNGSSCYPIVPFSSGDVSYVNSLEQQLNAVIKQAAQANGATYVDTFTSSIGHDACRGSSAWVNGIIPTSAAFPLHPNQAGEANMAKQVEGSL
jgi:lysophospholipase L1-like esterase